MKDDMPRIILDMVQNSGLPIKTIAEKVGKPHSALLREINPTDTRAKLGVELLLPLMDVCKSISPLRHMAAAMGYRVSSMHKIIPDKSTFHEELLDTYQALAAYHKAMMDGLPMETVEEHREVLLRQLKEDFVAFMEWTKRT